MRTKTFLSLDDLKEIIQASSLIPHLTKIESIKIRMADNTPQGGPDGVEIETETKIQFRE